VDACFGHVDFVLSDGGVQSKNLAVEVGEHHAVVVDEVQFADTASGKHFGYVSSHATDAEDGYLGFLQFFNGICAEEKFCS